MAKVLVLYYSMYGHVETLAHEAAAGAADVPGTEVAVKRVPETMPREEAEKAGAKRDQEAPVAAPEELADYDAIIVGTPTRFGNMAAQMRQFWDRTGPLWMEGRLVGKLGSVFTATATGGGNETTIVTSWTTLAHHGMIIVPLPYAKASELLQIDEVRGGSPYGAGTLAGPDGSRLPSDRERALARAQGRHVAEIARRLFG